MEEKKYFIVSILCTRGAGFAQFMGSGIRVNGTRQNYLPVRDRSKAARFSKFVAEDLAERLNKGWRLTTQVEPAPETPLPTPYQR